MYSSPALAGFFSISVTGRSDQVQEVGASLDDCQTEVFSGRFHLTLCIANADLSCVYCTLYSPVNCKLHFLPAQTQTFK